MVVGVDIGYRITPNGGNTVKTIQNLNDRSSETYGDLRNFPFQRM
jgi:hypothetical protein